MVPAAAAAVAAAVAVPSLDAVLAEAAAVLVVLADTVVHLV